jgi:hypothetical protein
MILLLLCWVLPSRFEKSETLIAAIETITRCIVANKFVPAVGKIGTVYF